MELKTLLRHHRTPDRCLPRRGTGSTCPKKRSEEKMKSKVDQATKGEWKSSRKHIKGDNSSVHKLHPLTLPVTDLHQHWRQRHPVPQLFLGNLQAFSEVCLSPDQRPRPCCLAHTDTPRDSHSRCLRVATHDSRLTLAVRASYDGLVDCRLLEGLGGERGREEHLQVLQRRGNFESGVGWMR